MAKMLTCTRPAGDVAAAAEAREIAREVVRVIDGNDDGFVQVRGMELISIELIRVSLN